MRGVGVQTGSWDGAAVDVKGWVPGKVREEWEEVRRESRFPGVMNGIEYVDHWYACFARPDQVRFLRAVADGKVVGMLPVVVRRARGCREMATLTNDHSLQAALVVRKGYEEIFPHLLGEAIARAGTAWDVLRLEYSYSFSPAGAVLPDAVLRKHGWRAVSDDIPTYAVSLDTTYEEYLRSSLSAKTRSNYLRSGRHMSRDGACEVRHYRDVCALEHWEQFTDIEDSGWKGRRQSSIKRLSPAYARYYQGLIRILAHGGALHLHLLEFNGQPVAGVFGYVDGPVFHYVKTGYREEWARYSPSIVLLLDMLAEQMQPQGEVALFHLFPWDYGYKHKFADVRGTCFNTLVFNATVAGRTAFRLLQAKRRLKKLLRGRPVSRAD